MKTPTICTLIENEGNRRLLHEWIRDHDSYRLAPFDDVAENATVDLCIVDRGGFHEHNRELRSLKRSERPTILPILLLSSENGSIPTASEPSTGSEKLAEMVDDMIRMPISQAELSWRLQSLLRLRDQSRTIHGDLLRFKKGVEASGVGIFITDTDGKIEYVNQAWEEITGYAAEEALGENPRILKSGRHSAAYYENLWDTIRNGGIWSDEITDRRKDGEEFTIKQTISPVIADGSVEAFVGVMTDISDRIRRENKLRQRTRAIDNAPVGILITGPAQEDNPLIYMNDAVEEITGYGPDDLLGKNLRLLQGENTDKERVAEFRDAIKAERPVTVELRNYRKDGSEFWNRMGIAPIKDDEGEVDVWVGFQEDVTQRKQRTNQLSIMNRWLRHTLRNDMNVVRGQAEIIRSRDVEEINEPADKILDVSDHLIDMTEKAKEITSILRTEPETREIDVEAHLEAVLKAVQSEYPKASMTIECPDGITASPAVNFDAAITELLTNAIIHNDTEKPTVAVTVTDRDGTLDIEIADNGPTIAESERQIELDESENPLSHGSGLGMWLVKTIVTRSGGSLVFEENSPRGNRIHIKLPRK